MSVKSRKPLVRKELIIVRREDEGICIIKDPISEKYFEVGELECKILQLMDGTRTLSEIYEDIKRQGEEIDFGLLVDFLGLLERNRFIDSGQCGSYRVKRKVLQELSLIRIRFAIPAPVRLIDFILEKMGFLIGYPFVVFSVVGSIVAFCIVGWRHEIFHFDFAQVGRLGFILVFYFLAFSIMTLHEFAHAVVCRKFGGEVREMGFMILYFIPCFYTDVSDIYLMKRKRHRIAVICAGIVVEMAIWSIFTISYFFYREFYASESFTATVLYVGFLTSGFKSLFVTMNPAIKMDGYYLFEELIGVENLMQKAGLIIGSMVGLNRRYAEVGEIVDRKKRLLAGIYGGASVSYMLIMGAISLFYFIYNYHDSIGRCGSVIVIVLVISLMVFYCHRFFTGRIR